MSQSALRSTCDDNGAAAGGGPAAGFVERAGPRTMGARLEDGGPAQRYAGRGTVRILSAGSKNAAWKLRAEYRSPRWTARWDELPTAKPRDRRASLPNSNLNVLPQIDALL